MGSKPKVAPAPPPRRRRFARIAGFVVLGLLLVPALLIVLFRFVPPPVTPLMLVRLAEGYGLHHEWVPYDRISRHMVEAAVASEDALFCREKSGIDVDALAAQLAVWSHGEKPRGASTITMQTARNLLLWPGRDVVRKIIEAWLTPQIALLWPKRRVMEVYLNIIEFGPGIYGAEAAAHRIYGRSAATVTMDEAVRLIAVLPDPLNWSAAHPTPLFAPAVRDHRAAHEPVRAAARLHEVTQRMVINSRRDSYDGSRQQNCLRAN